jgi:hypothetical protein
MSTNVRSCLCVRPRPPRFNRLGRRKRCGRQTGRQEAQKVQENDRAPFIHSPEARTKASAPVAAFSSICVHPVLSAGNESSGLFWIGVYIGVLGGSTVFITGGSMKEVSTIEFAEGHRGDMEDQITARARNPVLPADLTQMVENGAGRRRRSRYHPVSRRSPGRKLKPPPSRSGSSQPRQGACTLSALLPPRTVAVNRSPGDALIIGL